MSNILLVNCVLLLLVVIWSGEEASSVPQRFTIKGKWRAEVGKTVTWSCYFFGRPTVVPLPTFYEWVKDGEVIPRETRGTLTLTNLTTQDAGIYQCGDPSSNVVRLEHDLYIFGAPVPQPVIRSLGGVAVCGRSFTLECLILKGYTQNDETRYTWYKNSTEVRGQSSRLLQFTRVKKTDSGVYTCTAREGPVESTSPPSSGFHLAPLVSPEVHIKPTSADDLIKAILGENLTLICEVTQAFPDVPADGYSWSYLPSFKGQSRTLERKATTLDLGPLTREDGGQYFCQARNDQLFSELNLIGNASIAIDVVYLQNITLLSDLEVDEGKPVTLTCRVDSHPAARLAWTVHGQEVRHVTDNLDHYVIPSASCSDSTSYTCHASNTDMPGREISATSRVLVHCKQVLTPSSDIATTEVSAMFDFRLHNKTSMVVAHPVGQDILTVQQDCSLNISAFLPRCLCPHCDLVQRHLSFTLIKVTEKDEGSYSCRETGKDRRLIPNCGKRLLLKNSVPNITHLDGQPWTWSVVNIVSIFIGIVLTLAIFLIIKCRIGVLILCWRIKKYITEATPTLLEWFTSVGRSQKKTAMPMTPTGKAQLWEMSRSFEKLYNNGKAYVIPLLMEPVDEGETDESEVENESSTPLLSLPLTGQGAEFIVKDRVRSMLQESTKTNNQPSFLLHNTCLSRQENIILVLSRKLGVIVMTVKAVEDVEKLQSMDKAVRQLLEARDKIRERLGGLVKLGAVTAVLALPNLPSSNMEDVRQRLKILRPFPDVELLLGQEGADFQLWTEALTSRPDSGVWNLSSPGVDSADTAYKMAAGSFLTLIGCSPPGESPSQPAAEECWLLTPAQLQVRDSTARLLHIWGPPGSGKTSLLIQKAREWLAEGNAIVAAVGCEIYTVLLAHITEAVQRGQGRKSVDKIRVCQTHTAIKRAVEELRGRFPEVRVHVIVDTLHNAKMLQSVLKVVKSKQAAAVWSACRHNLQAIDTVLSKKAQNLGWESACLPDCIRCTESTVELLNLLVQGSPDHTAIPACSLPRARDIPAWTVVDHCLQPQHTSTTSSCLQCRKEMSAALPSLDDSPDWRNWIALYTGNPDLSIDIRHLCNTLLSLDIPVTYDEEEVSSYRSCLDTSKTEFELWQKRLVTGVDKIGNPAVHLVRMKDFIGLQRRGVVVIHWDQRDNDQGCQRQGEREARLKQHRRQWFNAVSSSKGQVILLLLTPSPARTLLNLPEPVMQQGKHRDGTRSHLPGQLETRVEVHV